ncbi:MAG: ECF transporter S component, partial [Fusobacteriaceae bacterium]
MKKTKNIAMVGILGALSFIIMMIEIPFPLAPWLKFDFSDLVILFGGLVGGYRISIGVTIIKLVLNMMIRGTQTAGIGEITSFIATMAYVIPVIYIYKKNKTILFGLLVGTITLTILLIVLNYFYITPFYAKLYKMDFILDMINKKDDSYLKYILYYYGLFNITKGIILSLVYSVVDKRVRSRYGN